MADAHLTERHARALLKLRDEKTQLELVDKVAKKSLSVKETESSWTKRSTNCLTKRATVRAPPADSADCEGLPPVHEHHQRCGEYAARGRHDRCGGTAGP